MNAKTERYEMRFDKELLEKLDTWCENQMDRPSRAEGIRRLIDAGLASKEKLPKIDYSERLIISMLCEIYKHLDIDGELDANFIQSVIHGGHFWAFDWKYAGLFHEHEDSKKSLRQVVDILDMWTIIENSLRKLPKKEKDTLKTQIKSYNSTEFNGFDANEETEHYGIAQFLIEEMGRFKNFKGRYLNTHSGSLDKYKAMLKLFEPMRKNLTGQDLQAEQLAKLLNAN